MTRQEIESYLQKENLRLEQNVIDFIEKTGRAAELDGDLKAADYYWRMGQIFYVQRGYLMAYQNMKSGRYESAWETLEQTAVMLSYLEQNFSIGSNDEDKYHLFFIKNIILEYEKLFPYQYYIGREAVIKKERCTVCGEPFRLRGGCGHVPGKLYGGKICLREPLDMEYLKLVAVNDPFDRMAALKPYVMEYNYEMLNTLMKLLTSPYEFWYVEIEKEVNPAYRDVQRNDKCPCGSGKKFKFCCMGHPEKMYFSHYKLKLMNDFQEHPDQKLKLIQP